MIRCSSPALHPTVERMQRLFLSLGCGRSGLQIGPRARPTGSVA